MVFFLSNSFVEPTTGIEPVNLFLTKEVLYLLSYVGDLCPRYSKDFNSSFATPETATNRFVGAGNGSRTRDPQLGRLMLYQLSYSRFGPGGRSFLHFSGGGGRIRTSEG